MNPATTLPALGSTTTPSLGPRTLADLPSPRGLPLIGNLHQLQAHSLHLTLEGWQRELGSPYSFRLGRQRVVVIADAQAQQTALRQRPELYRRSSMIESVFEEMGANGLFSVEGPAWRPQRKLVMQALSPAQIKRFHPTLTSITERLRRRLQRAAAAGEVLEMTDELRRYTVDVTTALAFGEDPRTLDDDGDTIQQHLAQLFPMIMRRVNAPLPWWRYLKMPRDRRFDRSLAAVHAHVRGLIDRARTRLRASAAEAPRNALEALLIEAARPGSGLGDAEISANVITLLLAGEDTTANTLAWTLHQLAQHPAWQNRLHGQACAVLGADPVCASADDLARLDAFEACATEATRLRPVVPLFFMETRAPVELAGVQLPAHMPVIALTRPPMLDERNFALPTQFHPERWLADDETLPLRTGTGPGCPFHAMQTPAHEARAWVQFGAGPRVCPGRHLASQEIRLVLSMLMRHFRVEHTVDPASIGEFNAFTMMPTQLPLRLRPR